MGRSSGAALLVENLLQVTVFWHPEHIPVRVVHTSPTTAYIERLDGKDDIPLVSFKREAMKQAVTNH